MVFTRNKLPVFILMKKKQLTLYRYIKICVKYEVEISLYLYLSKRG